MKQFIKDRIKELDVCIGQNKSVIAQINNLPLSVRIQPEYMDKKRIVNKEIESLVIARQKNDDILKGNLSNV